MLVCLQLSSFQGFPQKQVKGIPCLTGLPVAAEHGSTGYSYHWVSACLRSKPATQGKWKELRILIRAKWKGGYRGFLYHTASQIRSTSGFMFSAPSFRSKCEHGTGTHPSLHVFHQLQCICSPHTSYSTSALVAQSPEQLTELKYNKNIKNNSNNWTPSV